MRLPRAIWSLFGARRESLRLPEWVDEFIDRVRPYVFVREEDCLLIRMPNQAVKLNPQGAGILKALLDGARSSDVERRLATEAESRDVSLFLMEVRRYLDGTFSDMCHSDAVEQVPFTLGFSSLPVLSEIALTYRCNLKCRFCYAGCNCTAGMQGSGREMSTQEIARVLHKIRHEAQVPSVSFTGGEATLRADLPELIEEAKRIGLRVNLITNGTLVDRGLARSLAGAGLDSAQVSLEGVSSEVHDRITGMAGAFDLTVGAERHFRETGVNVHTNTTMNRMNLDDCLAMPAFVKETLCAERFSMNLVIPAGSAGQDSGLWLRYSEVGPYVEEIAGLSKEAGVVFMWYSPVPMCMFNSIAHGLGNKGCSACDGLLSVGPGGEVLPCSSYDVSVGNILTDDFREVWDSDAACSFRGKEFAHAACRGCEDFAACHGACPLYWRSVGYEELEERIGREAHVQL